MLTTVKIAWRNLGRNRKRTSLAVAAIALGQLFLVFANGFMAGWYEDMMNTITGPFVGHVQVQNKEWREERAVDLTIADLDGVVGRIRAVPGVCRVSARTYSPALVALTEDAEMAVTIGLDVQEERGRHGILASLDEDQLPAGKGVVVGKAFAEKVGIEVGDTLAIVAQDSWGSTANDLFEVRAVMPSSLDLVNRRGVLMAIDEAQEFLMLPDQAHEIIVHGESSEAAKELAEEVGKVSGLEGASALRWEEALPEFASIVRMKSTSDLIVMALVFVAAAAGVANTMMMSTFERIHEFGMLLSLGTRPGRIVKMILVESVVLGLLGVVIGSVLGTALVLWTGNVGINYGILTGSDVTEFAFRGVSLSFMVFPRFEAGHVTMGIVAVMITSLLASIWPAAIAARLEPVKALRS